MRGVGRKTFTCDLFFCCFLFRHPTNAPSLCRKRCSGSSRACIRGHRRKVLASPMFLAVATPAHHFYKSRFHRILSSTFIRSIC